MADERSLEALRNVRRKDTGTRLTLTGFKMLVREQFFMLLLDQEGALAAITEAIAGQCKRTPRSIHGDSRSAVRKRRNLG